MKRASWNGHDGAAAHMVLGVADAEQSLTVDDVHDLFAGMRMPRSRNARGNIYAHLNGLAARDAKVMSLQIRTRNAGLLSPQSADGETGGYADMTVAQVSEGVKTWNRPMLEAALEYEQAHAKRKGALSAIESALAAKEEND